jgi:hypothetical protein
MPPPEAPCVRSRASGIGVTAATASGVSPHTATTVSRMLVGDDAMDSRRDGPRGEERDDDQSLSSRIAHAAGAALSGAGRSA